MKGVKEYFGHADEGSAQNIKEEMEAMRKDIEDLIKRLGNIKNNSGDILMKQLDNLSEVIAGLKDRAVSTGRDNLADLYSSTRKHPLRNLAYAFSAGCVLAWFMKK